MNPKISGLESHLGYWLRFVSNHVSHAFRLKVESRGVTVAEWVVMRAMFDLNGINPSELADKIGLTRGAVSKLVDRLVAKRFLLRRANQTDRRRQTLSLSTSGKRLVPVLADLADQNDRQFFGHLSDPERAALRAALRGIVQRHGLKTVPLE